MAAPLISKAVWHELNVDPKEFDLPSLQPQDQAAKRVAQQIIPHQQVTPQTAASLSSKMKKIKEQLEHNPTVFLSSEKISILNERINSALESFKGSNVNTDELRKEYSDLITLCRNRTASHDKGESPVYSTDHTNKLFSLVKRGGDPHEIAQLIEWGADVSAREDGKTPLMIAVEAGNKELAKKLIEAGADVEATNLLSGKKALHLAVDAANEDMVSLLIEGGANVNAAELHSGKPPLCLAVENRNISMAKKLIQARANVNAKDDTGTTPLLYAIKTGNEEMVAELIQAKADVNAGDETGKTALMEAVFYDNRNMTTQLLAAGANINAKDGAGRTVLMRAVSKRDLFTLLLQAGANVNETTNDGRTALMIALSAKTINMEVIRQLVQAGAKNTINAKDSNGRTALMYAVIAKSGKKELVTLLLQADAVGSINAKDTSGRTALMHTVLLKGKKDLAEELIRAGANLNAEDEEGITILSRADLSGNKELAELLRERGALPTNENQLKKVRQKDDFQKRLKARNYTCNLELPRIPSEDNAIDRAKATEWVSAHDASLQPAAQNLVDKTEYVSFKEFHAQFLKTVKKIDDAIPDDEEYVILVTPGKSTEWLAELALPHLKRLPHNILTIPGKASEKAALQAALRGNKKIKHVIILDDASYSGEQMSRYVSSVTDSITTNSEGYNSGYSIHVGVPYMTDWGMDAVKKGCVQPPERVKLNIYSEKRMASMAEQIDPRNHATMNKMYFSNQPEHEIAGLSRLCRLDPNDKEREEILKRLAVGRTAEEMTKLNELLDTMLKDHYSKQPPTGSLFDFSKKWHTDFPSFSLWETAIREICKQLPNEQRKVFDYVTKVEQFQKKDRGMNSRTLTYFQHKVPDSLSTVSVFQAGCPIHSSIGVIEHDGTDRTQFVKYSKDCEIYKALYGEKRGKLDIDLYMG